MYSKNAEHSTNVPGAIIPYTSLQFKQDFQSSSMAYRLLSRHQIISKAILVGGSASLAGWVGDKYGSTSHNIAIPRSLNVLKVGDEFNMFGTIVDVNVDIEEAPKSDPIAPLEEPETDEKVENPLETEVNDKTHHEEKVDDPLETEVNDKTHHEEASHVHVSPWKLLQWWPVTLAVAAASTVAFIGRVLLVFMLTFICTTMIVATWPLPLFVLLLLLII